jgi:predicted nuclease of predicted toxin-antitoxin system
VNLVADENLHGAVVERLRSEGHHVIWIPEIAPRLPDAGVMQLANEADAVLITEDKDFGELVFRQRLVSSGVLLLRLAGASTERKAAILLEALEAHGTEMIGAFTVVSSGVVRIRRSGA